MAQQSLVVKASLFSRIHDHIQTHHNRENSSGRVVSPSQGPLPDKKQHAEETDIHACGGIRSDNPNKRETADPSLDRAATENGFIKFTDSKTPDDG